MNQRAGGQTGAAAIEVALLLPVFMLLVFGIIEFGLVFNRWISVTHAAREGVRQYSIGMNDATAEARAENASPDLAGSIACLASEPASDEVMMTCETEYELTLFVIKRALTITSSARMRAE